MFQPTRRQFEMRGALVSAILVFGLLTGGGCALQSGPPCLKGLAPVARPYSRNWVVCAPTAVGNYAGALAGGVLSAPFAATAELYREGAGEQVIRVFATVPALLAGGTTGLPFLPLSYLADENPCGTAEVEPPRGKPEVSQ